MHFVPIHISEDKEREKVPGHVARSRSGLGGR
jgi:hypothetical protein